MKSKLQAIRVRLYINTIAKFIAKGITIAATFCIIYLAIDKFAHFDIDSTRVIIGALSVGVLSGLTFGLFKKITIFDAALACDIHLGLKERISTALEFENQSEINPLVVPLLEDATRTAQKIQPRRDFPLRVPREIILAGVLILISVGLTFVPSWHSVFASEEKKEELKALKSQSEHVREIARQLELSSTPEIAEEVKKIADELKELAKDIDLGKLSKKEALEKLGRIEDKIDELDNKNGTTELKKQLAKMAEKLSKSSELQALSEKLKEGDPKGIEAELEKLAKKLDSGEIPMSEYQKLADQLKSAADSLGNSPEMQDMKSALKEAAQSLEQMAKDGSDSKQLSPEEIAKKLVEAIDKASDALDAMENIPDDVKKQAKEIMESVKNDLQKSLDEGTTSNSDIKSAQEKLSEAKKLLEQYVPQKSEEEIAQELMEEAEKLSELAEQMDSLDESQKSEAKSKCEGVKQKLDEQKKSGSCNSESNQEAREKLDQVREMLKKEGATEQQMGKAAQCNNPSASSQSGNPSQKSALDDLKKMMGMCDNPGFSLDESQQNGGKSMQKISGEMQKFGENLNNSQKLNNVSKSLGACRSGMTGQKSGTNKKVGKAAGGWGTETSPYAVENSPLDSTEHKNEDRQDSSKQKTDERPYEELYDPTYTPGQSYDTQLQGKFTDEGGSFVFTKITDPQTGETSYVPYFELEPGDVSALLDAVEDQEIPRSYADFVRMYFEQLAAQQ